MEALNAIKESFLKAKQKSSQNEPRFIKDQMVEIGQTAQQSLMRFLKELKTYILNINDIIYDKQMHAYL